MYLVCGEALFDVFDVTATNDPARVIRFEAVAGGSPYNVAIGVRRLGVPVQYFGALSNDSLGRRLQYLLDQEGVDTTHVVIRDAPTTLAMVTLDEQGHPRYDFRGKDCADRQITLQALPTLDDAVQGLHVGSYSLVVEPIGSALLQLAERESGRRLLTLDPNVRLNVEPDITLWRARIETFAPLADVIKVSDEDLALLYAHSDSEDTVKRWLKGRCQLIVLTRGQHGARVYTRTEQWDIPANPVAVQDTVGAGDSFQAALIAQLVDYGAASAGGLARLARKDLEHMIAFAQAAAALTCSRKGPDLPSRSDVDAFLANCP